MIKKLKKLIFLAFVLVIQLGCNETPNTQNYVPYDGPQFNDEAYKNYKAYHKVKDETFSSVPTTKDVETYVSEQTNSPTNCFPELGAETPIPSELIETTLPKILPSGRKVWSSDWSNEIYNSLGEEHLSPLISGQLKIHQKDLEAINCPNFNKMNPDEKRKFWIVFMASVAKPESDYNPKTVYPDYDGTDSTGLLQIDKHRANEHCVKPQGIERFTTEHMKDPKLNLRCGLQIMKHQLNGGIKGSMTSLRGRLFTTDRGSPYYWSVLHGRKRQIVQNTFKAHAKSQLPFCSGQYVAKRGPAGSELVPKRLGEIARADILGQSSKKCTPSINTDKRKDSVDKDVQAGEAAVVPQDGSKDK